jgi:WD40 repeat protein
VDVEQNVELIRSTAFSPDGKLLAASLDKLAVGGALHKVRIYDAQSLARIGEDLPHEYGVGHAAFGSDSQTLLTLEWHPPDQLMSNQVAPRFKGEGGVETVWRVRLWNVATRSPSWARNKPQIRLRSSDDANHDRTGEGRQRQRGAGERSLGRLVFPRIVDPRGGGAC